MGRAGSDSDDGGHSSSGHSVGSRGSGGHRVGSGSSGTRARGRGSASYGGSSRRFSNTSYGGCRGGHMRIPIGGGYGGYRGSGLDGGSPRSSVLITALIMITLVVLVLIGLTMRNPKSTINREKLDGSVAYINDCIVDDLGWFSNTKKASKSLQSFYKKTGVQPYIVLHQYDTSLKSDSDKEAWAVQYYDSNIGNENTFLFVYFAEANADTDVGYMCHVNGKKVSSVMDAEAVDIFWSYIDKYWYSDMATDALFTTVFDKTASTIMRVSKTWADVVVVLIVGIMIVGVFAFLYMGYRKKLERERQRAEETERILNSSMQDLVNDVSGTEDLTYRYD